MRALRARYRKIDKIAIDLVEQYDQFSAPIDIFMLAKCLDLEIRISDLGTLSMVMRRQAIVVVVVVNRAESILRQRFAVAHALGHVMLHPEIIEHADQRFMILGRNLELAPEKNIQEKEANYFASVVLIPERTLHRELELCPRDDFGEIDVCSLADKFCVSRNLMLVRLCGMENHLNVVSIFIPK